MLLRRLLEAVVVWLVLGGAAIAQVPSVVEDATAVGTVVTPGVGEFTITGGTASGQALFHSFDTFSPHGWSAIFDLDASSGYAGIESIFGRVTGAEHSIINGRLSVVGGNRPDLFLFNPNGITLEGAYLDLAGSFSASTATSVLFEGGWQFSATEPEASVPLLQVSVPVGLQYGAVPASIDVRNIGLTVQSGRYLNLLGGEVSVMSAYLGAPEGSINLSGDSIVVQSAGLESATGSINLSGDSVAVQSAGLSAIAGSVNLSGSDIALSNISVTTSTDSVLDAGDIDISGDVVTLQSLTLAGQSTAAGNAGSIHVTATDTLLLESASLANYAAGTGAAGDVTLSAQTLTARNGSNLNSSTNGGGAGGDISFLGETTLLEDVSFSNKTDGAAAAGNLRFVGRDRLTLRRVGFSSETNGSGDAGNVAFVGGQVLLEEANFGTPSNGSGSAGQISFTADNLHLANSGFGSNANAAGDGGSVEVSVAGRLEMQTSGFGTDTYGTGRGGDIVVTAEEIVLNRSGFGANTLAAGDAGVVTVVASSIEMQDSGIDSEATTTSTGNAGDINITTGTLVLSESGIGTEAKGTGQGSGGQITIIADEITLREQDNDGRRTELDSQSLGGGDSGGIAIKTGALNIEGGIISIANFGTGGGGSLEIDAQGTITLSEQGSIFAANGTGATGAGNDAKIVADTLILQDGSDITVATGGEGTGGNLLVFADTLQVLGGSEINASSLSEIGFTLEETYILSGEEIGNLTLVTPTLPDGTQYGDAGDVVVSAGNITVSGTDGNGVASKITSFSETTAAAGSIEVSAESLQVDEAGEISVSGLGEGSAGNLLVHTHTLALDHGASLQARARSGSQGNLFVTASDLAFLRGGSFISTDATEQANGGNITIQSPVIVGFENSDIAANAVTGNGGRISIATEGLIGLQFRDRLTDQSDITASSQLGIDGTVELEGFVTKLDLGLVSLPESLADASSEVTKGCAATGEESRFVASGRGGVPVSPAVTIDHARPWADIRDVSAFRGGVSTTEFEMSEPNTAEPREIVALVEADGWQTEADGTVHLLSVAAENSAVDVASCAVLSDHTFVLEQG
ncbi:MAG: filamentous hemagglutinin N-terminal domain-containing protein [Cyanobacteria bacterium J06614_10]